MIFLDLTRGLLIMQIDLKVNGAKNKIKYQLNYTHKQLEKIYVKRIKTKNAD
jgi:hypothetical protein